MGVKSLWNQNQLNRNATNNRERQNHNVEDLMSASNLRTMLGTVATERD